MASIKQISDRKFKITVSNGYRPNGKKICKAKTITVPDSVKPRGIPQYVAHEAEELETPGEIRFRRGQGHHL
mgnify:CR=1 FL=1